MYDPNYADIKSRFTDMLTVLLVLAIAPDMQNIYPKFIRFPLHKLFPNIGSK